MRKLFSLLILMSSLTVLGQEQSSTRYTLGIKTGINFSTLLGTELENPRPRFGYTGGMYIQYPLRGKWILQTELLANLRGSKFNNPSGSYQEVDLFTIDLPILFGYELREDGPLLLAGLQPSTLLLSALFLDPKGKVHQTDLGLQPVFLDLVLGYQSKGPVVGYQLGLKGSVLDMDRDLYFEGIEPSTAHDGSIYNLSLELALIF